VGIRAGYEERGEMEREIGWEVIPAGVSRYWGAGRIGVIRAALRQRDPPGRIIGSSLVSRSGGLLRGTTGLNTRLKWHYNRF